MEKLIDIAKEDLETAQLIYLKGKYSSALYHYHQCVEKAVKFAGLSIGGISEKQLSTDIKHDPIKVFKRIYQHMSENSIGSMPPFDPHYFTNVKNQYDQLSDQELVKESIAVLNQILNERKQINEEQFPTPFDAVCDYMSKLMPEINQNFGDPSTREQTAFRMKGVSENAIIFINYGVKMILILLFNTMICNRYKPDEFRYPSDKYGNPVDYFTQNNAIVKALPIFLESMKIPISFADKINWKLD